MTYSKKIILASYICSILLTAVVIVGTIAGYDMTNVSHIAALAWGEVAVSNAFYFKKAEKENAIKIALYLSHELDQEFDINNIFTN